MKKLILIILLAMSQIAATWYVRPAGGTYGDENGTSYANAWDGLHAVVWGEGGVTAADTLYICGLHVYNLTTFDQVVSQGDIPSYLIGGTVSSGSAGNVITWRGDCPSDPGTIFGHYKLSYSAWTDEGSNTWSVSYLAGQDGDVLQDVTATSWTVLSTASSIENCQATAGSKYQDGTKLYVHLTDNGNPTGRIYAGLYGYDFKMDGVSYITISNLTLYYIYRNIFPTYLNNESGSYLSYINNTIKYGSPFWMDETHANITIDRNEISLASAGIYVVDRADGSDGNYFQNGTFTNNIIYDIGVTAGDQNADAHGIGIQNSSNLTISGNLIYNVGSGITLYGTGTDAISNVTIKNNIIHDTHTLGGANSRGIEFNQGTSTPKAGCSASYNLVYNVGDAGFRLTWQTAEVDFYNNVAYNTGTSFVSLVVNPVGAGQNVKYRNNISLDPTGAHFYFSTDEAVANYIINSDYNIFSPDGNLFYFNDSVTTTTTDFAGWKALVKEGSTFDPNSIQADPVFVDPANGNFKLKKNSAAINAGQSVNLTGDNRGNRIVGNPDIGAHELNESGGISGL